MKIVYGKSASGKSRKIMELAIESSKDRKTLVLTSNSITPDMKNLMGKYRNLVIINVDDRKDSIVANLFIREKIVNIFLDLDNNHDLDWLNLLISVEKFLDINIVTNVQCNPTVPMEGIDIKDVQSYLDSEDIFNLVVPG